MRQRQRQAKNWDWLRKLVGENLVSLIPGEGEVSSALQFTRRLCWAVLCRYTSNWAIWWRSVSMSLPYNADFALCMFLTNYFVGAAEDFSFDIQPDGKINKKEVTTCENTVWKNSQVLKMQTHHLCPPWLFTITFWLPVLVNIWHFSGNFGTDRILEGVVKKRWLLSIHR